MSGGAATRLGQEQKKGIESAKEKANPVAVEQSERLKALEQKEREKSLQNGTLLTEKKRTDFFDRFTIDGIGGYLTSAGTGVGLHHYAERRGIPIEGHPDGFTLVYRSADKRTAYEFEYDATGHFRKLDVFHAETSEEKFGRTHYHYKITETLTNLWAEKRGDSFIRDVQRTNKKDTEQRY